MKCFASVQACVIYMYRGRARADGYTGDRRTVDGESCDTRL